MKNEVPVNLFEVNRFFGRKIFLLCTHRQWWPEGSFVSLWTHRFFKWVDGWSLPVE